MSRHLVPVLLVAALGCSRAEYAKKQFGVQFSCPDAQVQITPRDDIKWSTVIMSNGSNETPSEEVKKDPERLAKWKKDQEEQSAPAREALDSADVFEGKGCGHEALIGCFRPAKTNGAAPPVNCQVAPEKPKTK